MRKSGLFGLIVILAAGIGPADAEFPSTLGAVEGKVVWIDFWASWCAPCRRSFPWMNAMHEKYAAEGLEIIAVNVDKERVSADEFLRDSPAAFRLHFDPAGDLALAFDVQAMPSSFLLDGEGNLLARHYGFKLASTEEYEREIRAALAD